MGLSTLDTAKYRQMAGRAGRAGQRTHGEAIVLSTEKDKAAAIKVSPDNAQVAEMCS